MDCSGGDSVPQVYQRVRRLEHGHRLLGSDVVRRATLLELVESGRYQVNRKGLPITRAHGMSGGHLPAHARLLAEGTYPPTDLCQSHADPRQAHQEPGHVAQNRTEQVTSFFHSRSWLLLLFHPQVILHICFKLFVFPFFLYVSSFRLSFFPFTLFIQRPTFFHYFLSSSSSCLLIIAVNHSLFVCKSAVPIVRASL